MTATSNVTVNLLDIPSITSTEELPPVEEILVENEVIPDPEVVLDGELAEEDDVNEEQQLPEGEDVTVTLTTNVDDEWGEQIQSDNEDVHQVSEMLEEGTLQSDEAAPVISLDFYGQNDPNSQRNIDFSASPFVASQVDGFELVLDKVTFAGDVDLLDEGIDPFGQALMLTDMVLQNNLDLLSHDLRTSYDDILAQQAFQIKLLAGTSVPFSIGFAGYLLRGGTLLSSMFSSASLVSTFDPIGILMPARKKIRKGTEETTDTTTGKTAQKVEQIFDNRNK